MKSTKCGNNSEIETQDRICKVLNDVFFLENDDFSRPMSVYRQKNFELSLSNLCSLNIGYQSADCVSLEVCVHTNSLSGILDLQPLMLETN